MFHRHKWVEQSRYFYQPPISNLQFESTNQDMVEKMLFGQTVVEDRCAVCNRLHVTSFNGRSRAVIG